MALFTTAELERIEGYLANSQALEILPALQSLVAGLEGYVDEHCPVTDEVQWFSFASAFEKLAYRRVEGDPRELRDAPAPFDRAYADYAFCLMACNDLERAAAALKQAVRWNPMDCAHRLDLAALLANQGDADESLRLSYSVFARASKPAHLVRAYLSFAAHYEQAEEFELAGACVWCALQLSPRSARVQEAARKLVAEHDVDAGALAAEQVAALLEPQGIPLGANVEVVVSALIVAELAREQGDRATAEDLTLVAVNLVGQEQAAALAQLVREQA